MIKLLQPHLPPKKVIYQSISKAISSGQLGEGEYVYKFEDEFACKFNYKNVLAVSSGTAALTISFILSDIQKGDEVITTSMTAEPTNTSIANVGAVPVFADVDPRNGNITAEEIEKKITINTKAICVVHYGGYPAEIDKIQKLAKKYNLKLIEDCAHSLGANYNNKPIGSFGNFSVFSFQAIKHITTIDGGILVIKDKKLLERGKKLRWFGLVKGKSRQLNNITEPGYKFNMNNISASLGLEQLKYFDDIQETTNSNAEFYDVFFSDCKELNVGYNYPKSRPSYWLYTILSKKSKTIEHFLNENNVQASKVHKPNHLHAFFKSPKLRLNNTDEFYKNLLHIPVGFWVTKKQREKIAKYVIKSFSK